MPLLVPSGSDRMIGCLYQTGAPGPRPAVLLLHGCPGYERNFDLAHRLVMAGYHAAVVHYRGAWGSTGLFHLRNVLDDAGAMLAALQDQADALRIDPARIVPVGHSMGGFAALTLGTAHPDVPAAGGLAAFNFGVHARLMKNVAGVREATLEHMAPLMPPLRGMTAPALVAEIEALGPGWNLLDRLADLAAKPVLLVGATDDQTGPVLFHHRPLVQALEARGAPLLTHAEIKAGHGFQGHRPALADVLLKWLDGVAGSAQAG